MKGSEDCKSQIKCRLCLFERGQQLWRLWADLRREEEVCHIGDVSYLACWSFTGKLCNLLPLPISWSSNLDSLFECQILSGFPSHPLKRLLFYCEPDFHYRGREGRFGQRLLFTCLRDDSSFHSAAVEHVLNQSQCDLISCSFTSMKAVNFSLSQP